MQTLHITSKELTQLQELGRGACSIVYKYQPNLVIKALNQKGIELHNEDEFSNLIGISNNTCVFPQNRVEIDGEFKGYTMECVQGVPLHEVIKKMNIATLIQSVKNVEDDLRQLSEDKILFQDLNQGGIMWDDSAGKIKIIDTDFFEKNKNIEPEQCYSANITSFNSMIEMELGIINGQGTKISEYLQREPEFSKLYTKYMIYSLNGRNMSITQLIEKAVEIFERKFEVKINSFEEMESLIGEKTENRENISYEEIPVFQPPEQESSFENKIGLKQRIANFLADKRILRKIPFIDKFITKEQRMLPEALESINERNTQTQHSKFVDEISNNGEYRKLSLGKKIMGAAVHTVNLKETTGIDDLKPHSLVNEERLEQMRKKIEGKSIDDD